MSTPRGGRSSDCPESRLQYCPLGQLEKLERIAEEMEHSGRNATDTATHLRSIASDMRDLGLTCVSGKCRFSTSP